jgi:transcriptional regulator with XRE-family HTH domain
LEETVGHPADDHVFELQRQLGEIRAKQGLHARKVAEDAHIDAAWLEEFEQGYDSGRSPTVRVMERVANALGKTLVLRDLP